VAMRDLEIRGAGNLLGTKQSGLINTVGINYYNRLLQQAIEYLEMNKEGAPAPVEEEVPLKKINVKQDVYFPSSYINDDTLRIQLYKRMGEFKETTEFDDFKQELEDRFGHLPKEAERTVDFYKLKFLADSSGLSGVRVRENALVMEFDENKLPAKAVLGQFITTVTSQVRFDTTKGLKIIVDINKKLLTEKDNLLQSIEFLEAYREIVRKK
ncbi:MAG: hypothetical protein JXR56_01275, partial [Candidatus Cloacimonetes bacterium]|nr:hypothetical protein [Candidatus Cloacimonadota bacterium]